ncbi:flagellar hook-associated protein FlgL [Thiorhodococcus minor]|uniref:Flagellar hook-associated protein 3 n=1 Tax=Thiorhodococcus minor TaxID=57489 RepID=A0A6M0JSN6_9GAMM|nr:flagellar hook-associated protein FlgL [Thiorhodococcus minor]NEV60536.1 flagellar hook-associated protein 3 [Thiorhodococcus minor]
MRISTSQIFQSGVSAMQRAQADLNHTSLQMATGRRILTPSDDPGGAAVAVQLQAAISSVEQYQRNVDIATPKLSQEEAQVEAAENILQRARELVLSGNNDTYSDEDRRTFASEIHQLREDLLDIANSKDSNGEHFFSGTRVSRTPFVVGENGQVSYVGAQGQGAVREVDLSATRRVATGDTGAYVFMEIPESSGLLTEAVPAAANSANLDVPGVAMTTEVADIDQSLSSAGETFRIRFKDDAGTLMYEVVDTEGHAIQDADGALIGGPYVPNEPIDFAGRRVTLTVPNTTPPTEPADGDEIISRPMEQVSIFQTLDDIASALESSSSETEARALLDEASSIAISNIDAGLERLNEVRSSVGLRLNVMETHADLNDQRLVDLNTTLSEVRDLDYAEAISRYKLQEVALQAAQQTYVQVSRLSLFDFL